MEAVPSDEGAYLFNGTILFYLNLVFFVNAFFLTNLFFQKKYVYLVEAIRNVLWHSDFFCIYDQSLLFFSSKGELLDSHVCTDVRLVHVYLREDSGNFIVISIPETHQHK